MFLVDKMKGLAGIQSERGILPRFATGNIWVMIMEYDKKTRHGMRHGVNYKISIFTGYQLLLSPAKSIFVLLFYYCQL